MAEPNDENTDQTSVFQLFAKYVADNRDTLSGVGIVATVTALFLNLDPATYTAGLRDLQVLLLLFLLLSLAFLAFSTFLWFYEKSDLLVGGLISITIGLLVWRLGVFIQQNFRTELHDYLTGTALSVVAVIAVYLYRIRHTIELRYDRHRLRCILYGLTAFAFLYTAQVFPWLYVRFATEKSFESSLLLRPFSNKYTWVAPTWIMVLYFYLDFFKQHKRWLLILLILPCLLFLVDFFFHVYFMIRY